MFNFKRVVLVGSCLLLLLSGCKPAQETKPKTVTLPGQKRLRNVD